MTEKDSQNIFRLAWFDKQSGAFAYDQKRISPEAEVCQNWRITHYF